MPTQKELTPAESLRKVEQAISTMREIPGITEDALNKYRAQMTAHIVEPARKTVQIMLLAAVRKVAESGKFKDNLPLLHGSDLAVYITVDKTGNVTIGEKIVVRRSSGTSTRTGGTGKRSIKIMPDGRKYDTWADLCRQYNLDINGDSAARVWKRAHDADATKYPMPDEVDQADDDEGTDEETETSEATA